jgi:hypothetical protein
MRSLIDFGRQDAGINIKLSIDSYFSEIQPHLDHLTANLRNRIATAIDELGVLENAMQDYNKSMQITGDFIRYVDANGFDCMYVRCNRFMCT